MKGLNGNKRFLKKMKPFFSDKGLRTNNIILKDKNRLVTESSIIATIFDNYFINTTNLNLKPSMPKPESLSDILKLHDEHFSVLKIKGKYKIHNNCQFREVSPDEVRAIIQSLNKKKSAIISCIPVKHLNESVDIYLPLLTDVIK